MGSDCWGVLRTIGLITMIVGAFIADALLWWQAQYWWATFWLAIILLVVSWDDASYAKDKKTISTRWKEWAQKKPFMAYLTLLILSLSLLGLWVHLAFWGGMFQ